MSGLLAAAPIRWLIDNEQDIRNAIVAFLEDRGDDRFKATLGPTNAERVRFRENPKKNKLMLDTVWLYLRREKNPVTGEHGVQVACSPEDMRKLKIRLGEDAFRKAINASTPRNMADRELG